jgi:hypothetical protein
MEGVRALRVSVNVDYPSHVHTDVESPASSTFFTPVWLSMKTHVVIYRTC